MKSFELLLVVPVFAVAQTSPTVITFNRADTEHCRVLVANGKPLLASTYNGTTVAVSMPDNWENGEYSLFVMVSQKGDGSAEINPKEIYALFSDPAHTRLSWFDKKHDLDTLASMRSQGMGQPGGAPGGPPGGFGGSNGDSSGANPPMTHPEVMERGGLGDTNQRSKSDEEARNLGLRNAGGTGPQRPQLDPAHPPAFLKHTTVKAGSQASGYVFVRKPKDFRQEVTATSILGEIDIPVNGTVFRF
ncbi:MAG: hypothetical protein JST28_09435 [Acidobacteria bacterium]|nr:hypothetical protein [Acidobacteriota bacterium]